ncbi:MAG: hypothetical protein LBR70_07120 [Lactobacillaceae bacterium]|jgi:hypothetical protein|nr:hypothetical protein [Lactobacillaceae bacterium]
MKKIIALVTLVLAAACSPYDYIDTLNSYPVEIYGQDPVLVNDQYMEERAQPVNQVLSAYVGYTVVDKKIYRKKTYATEEVRATKDGVMSGSAVPVEFKRNEKRAVVGMAYLDEENYLMIPADLPDYVILINREGKVYKNLGQLKGYRLVLIDTSFIVSPSSFRFELVTSSKSNQSRPERGFDIKYGGIKNDRMVFTYMDYSKIGGGDRGYFEDITFPLNQEVVEIEGVGIKVLKATNHKLDYIIVQN